MTASLRIVCCKISSTFKSEKSVLLVGASSGLHHDYHDNLYVLIKGKKRFKLYNPLQAENMYTVGKIVEVHKNGRIVYEGQVRILSPQIYCGFKLHSQKLRSLEFQGCLYVPTCKQSFRRMAGKK